MNHKLKTESNLPSKSSLKDVASLIDHIRLRSFPNALAEYLASLCHFDSIIMVTYKEGVKPIMVYPLDTAQHSQTLKLYLEKSYILDPLYSVISAGNPPAVSRLTDISPDSFESTEYYQNCYKDFNFADEINLIIQLDNQNCRTNEFTTG